MWGPLPLGHSPRFLPSASWSYLLHQIWKLWCTLKFPSASHLLSLSLSLLPLRTPWLCILGAPILCRFPNSRGPKQLGRAEPCARWLALTDLRWCAWESGAKRTLSWFPFLLPFSPTPSPGRIPPWCSSVFVDLILFRECWWPFFLLFLSLASLQVLFLSFLVMSFFKIFKKHFIYHCSS